MLFALLSIAVFASAVAVEFAACNYFQALNALQANRASSWSVIWYIIGAIGYISAVKTSLWLMVPECLGLFVGTRIAIARKAKSNG